VREGDAPTLYVHAPDVKAPRGLTAERVHVPVHHGVFDLHAVMKLLAEREINVVHVETGATLAGALLASGLVDELLLYVAPVLLGAHARPLFDGLDVATMAERLELEILETRRLGTDLRILLRPPESRRP
jgi:diaminohydroxyphosphoribosylaminopyrimidine deaminase/5-amino-6-(5-phosphoribosylamino)uracil reductase